MGSMSTPCADGRINQAMAGGEDGVVVTCDGSEGSERRLKWGGHWCNCLAREEGAMYWGRLLRGWLGLAMVVGRNNQGVWLL